MGCIGTSTAADCRGFDAAPAGPCRERSGDAGWWGSKVECVSALARLERDAALDPQVVVLAFSRLEQLAAGWHEVDPSDILRETAARFLRVHPLRAADALQLAAAFISAEQRPASLEMLTLDDLLAGAAQKEGFAVIDVARDHGRGRGRR